ncbi:MAG TPA: copper resistance CopC family protein [Phycicoccus sp.]|nr:copper resistance CopC family protein [Phycicoccus sp.]
MIRRALLALLVAMLALAIPAAAARAALPAHAQLVSTTPADGASVATATEVTLTFSEDVNARFVQVRVEGARGDETDGAPSAQGGTVTQPLAADLPAGEHMVTFRVVSVDGHPVSGTFAFTTTRGPATATATSSPTPTATSTAPTVVSSPGPSPSPVPTSSSSEGVPGWLIPAVLAIIAVLVVVPALLLSRRTTPPVEAADEDLP